ncbi:MAG: hypothetical protein H6869_09240 [Rhodospirillales bacterium]|nr:hypothetical protein [Rhodospirillales bacterium]
MSNELIEEETRKQIACFLPDAIARALTSYHEFSQQPPSEDAKLFTAHHNACKVAIAHIELLIKLARWADLPDVDAENHNQQIVLAAMVKEAEGELEAYKKQEKLV